MTNKLSARGVRIEYTSDKKKTTVACENFDLEIRTGEFLAIVGPSGCGKTTFLMAVDGLIPVNAGTIELDGKPITRPGGNKAMVFQSPSLLPWRDVRGNVRYGLELRGTPRSAMDATVERLVRMVGLLGFERHFPSELSGGMQQRVNLARALAMDPDLLLLDEPFSALDAQTREFMQYELLKIWAQSRKTALFVTHDIAEAIFLADRVAVISARPGRVKEVIPVPFARPRQLRLKRTTEFLAILDRIWDSIEEEARKQGIMIVEEDEGEAAESVPREGVS